VANTTWIAKNAALAHEKGVDIQKIETFGNDLPRLLQEELKPHVDAFNNQHRVKWAFIPVSQGISIYDTFEATVQRAITFQWLPDGLELSYKATGVDVSGRLKAYVEAEDGSLILVKDGEVWDFDRIAEEILGPVFYPVLSGRREVRLNDHPPARFI
jgi:hypothetical protein